MRNLKRVLSLALASIMLLGMMVIGASAADKTLTDLDTVTNKEAVNLMVDLGIITGKPDGSFAPKETVDRATMTKLITYIMMGDVDPTSFEGTTTSLKDIDSSWAKGYIKYCYANGIVSGDGTGNFMPTAKVNAVSAAKMLLVALGYDAEAQGYVANSNWSVNIMRDAQKAGLLNNLSVKANEELTRDNAAQMVYNAMFANTVTNVPQWDSGNKYIQTTTKNDTTLGLETYGLVKVTGTVASITGNGKIAYAAGSTTVTPSNVTGMTPTIASGDISMVGQTISTYYSVTYGLAGGNVVVSTTDKAFTTTGVANRVLYTDTKGTAVGKLVADKVIALDDTTVQYVQNGSAPETGYICDGSINSADKNKVSSAAAAAAYSAMASWTEPVRGSIVEYIDTNSDGKIDMVVQSLWSFGQVANKSTKTNAETLTLRVGASTVTIDLEDIISGFDAVEKDDYVNIQKMADSTYKVVPSELVTGTLTSIKNVSGSPSTVTIDGTVYTVSRLSRSTLVLDNTALFTPVVTNNEAKYYLDINGYVVASDAIETTKNYVAMLQTSQSGSGMLGDTTYSVLTVDADGTNNTYALSKAPTEFSAAFNTAFNNLKVSAPTTAYLAAVTFNADGEINGISGLTQVDTTVQTLNKNNASAFAGKYMSANTVFIFAKLNVAGTKVVSSVYTGLKNIPNGTYAKSTFIADPNTNEVKAVLVYDSAAATVAADYLYLNSTTYESYVSNGTTYRTYTFILSGEETPVTILDSAAGIITAGGTYKFSTDKDGITTLTAAGNIAAQNVTMVDPSYIVAGGTVVYLNADCKISDITGSVAAEGTLAKGQYVTYVTEYNAVNARNEAVAIFIVDEPNAAAPTAVSIDTAGSQSLTISGGTQSLIGGAPVASGFVDGSADHVKVSVTQAAGTTITAIKLDGGASLGTTTTDNVDVVSAGSHVLSITVKDNTSNKTTTYNYAFTVTV